MSQIATPLAVNPLCCSQNSQWSQNPNSAYQASYAEITKKAEELLKPQHSQEIKDFYNPGLDLDLYNLINELSWIFAKFASSASSRSIELLEASDSGEFH
ncbi:hypothetical protein V6N13_059733 [Hibiscus sabdariffa]